MLILILLAACGLRDRVREFEVLALPSIESTVTAVVS